MSPRPHFSALTGLRFFAALAIIYRHFGAIAMSRWPEPFPRVAGNGFVTVGLFFVLSGFVMTYNYVRPGEGVKGGPTAFWIARLSRIYPAYLVAFLLATPIFVEELSAHHSLTGTIARVSVGAPLVLTLSQAWIPWFANYWNSPAWSLSVEAFFYLLFPFLAPWIGGLRLKDIFPLAAGLWLASVVVPVLYCTLGHHWDTSALSQAVGPTLTSLLQCNPLLRLPEFLVGAATARLLIQGKHRPATGAILSLVAAIAILAVMATGHRIPEIVLGNGLMAPLFAALIWGLAQGGGGLEWFLSLRPIIFLGEISYSIYILQEPVFWWLRELGGFRFDTDRAFYAYLSLLLLCSASCFLLIERPAGSLIRLRLHALHRGIRRYNVERNRDCPSGQAGDSARLVV